MAHLPGLRSHSLVLLLFGLAFVNVPALAADPFDKGPELFRVPSAAASAEITAGLALDESKPDEAVLTVEIDLPPGFYLPSMAASNPKPTAIKLTKLMGVEEAGDWQADHEPKASREPLGEGGRLVDVEKFFDKVTFTRRMKVFPGMETVSAELVFDAQYCSSGGGGTCNLLINKVPVSLELEAAEPLPFEFRDRPTVLGGPYPGEARVVLAPQDAQPGAEVTVAVTVTLDDPWHVYSTTMEEQIGGLPTVITTEPFGLEPLGKGFATDASPEKHDNEFDEGLVLEYFEKSVTWTRSFKVIEARYGVRGSVRYQTCADGIGCKPPATVEFAVGGVAAVPAAPEQPVASSEPAQPSATEKSAAPVGSAAAARQAGLVPFLATAFAAGLLALLTPCVFPMIPITISFFLKQSEKEHTSPLALATVYALGIIATFTIPGVVIAAVFGATAITEFANNGFLNLAIAAVLLFFGASMLGMFEIRMPSWLVNWSAGKQSAGGYVGALFMAVTFTLISFTCTFAFAGFLLVWAAQGDYFWPILGMLAFSVGFSSPFFVLALVPSLLQKMPKSGGWMNAVKVTFGMVEIGAAIKFLSVADLYFNPVPFLFDASTMMTSWIVISFCTGLYLLGMFRLGHDTPNESISVPRLVAAMLFLCLGTYISIGVFSPNPPTGFLWRQIAAFVPGEFEGGDNEELGPYVEHDGLKYALDVDQAIAYAKAKNKPLFFDFTGVNCVNCREMEIIMKEPENAELLKEFVGVQLYLDSVPRIKDDDVAEALKDKNQKLAVEWLGDVTMPSYAIVTPDGQIVPGVEPFKGKEFRDGDFTAFLERGLDAWKKLSNERPRIASR